jgi:hypothetical protein
MIISVLRVFKSFQTIRLFLLLSLLFITTIFTAEAIMFAPGGCGTTCMSNQRQYNNNYINRNNCGNHNSNSNYNWNGVHAFSQFQTPWSNPNTYQARTQYPNYGNCYNCRQPSYYQGVNGSNNGSVYQL